MIFKVAILQTRADFSNIKRNIDTIICSMKEASKNGADILLLPECFITGYELPMTYEKSISCDDEVIKEICGVAKEYNIASYKVMERLGMIKTEERSGRKNRCSINTGKEYRYELLI